MSAMPQQSLQQAEQLLQKGWDFFDQEKFPQALKCAWQGMRRWPGLPDFQMLAGHIHLRVRKLARARYFFETVIRNHPQLRDKELFYTMGVIYQQSAEWLKAATAFKDMLTIDNRDERAYLKLGICFFEMEQLDRALQFYQTAYQLNPHNQTTRFRIQEAMHWVEMQQCVRIAPALPEPQANRFGATLHALKNAMPDAPVDSWDIMLFSFCASTHAGGGQHAPQLARAFRQEGHRVFFHQPYTGQVADEPFFSYEDCSNLQQESPKPVQLDGFRLLASAFTRPGHDKKLAIFTIWSPYLVGLIPVLKAAGYTILYWCVDDWQHFEGSPHLNAENEQAMINAADYVVATADNLADKMRMLSGKSCPVIPNGFSRANFPAREEKLPMPADMRTGEKTFLYWGDLSGEWFDWELLKDVATRHPQWRFNLIGPGQEKQSKLQLPNVHFLGLKPVQALQAYGQQADIAVIPFCRTQLIESVNPIKIYEYLACECPVIGPDIAEFRKFPCYYTANDAEAFEAAVRQIENDPIDWEPVRTFLRDNTWEGRAAAALKLLS